MHAVAPAVVVFGYDELVHATLDVVRAGGGRISAVVFPSVRRGDPRVRRVRDDVEASGLPVLEQPRRDSIDAFASRLDDLAPDLGIVWSYPMILPPRVLEVPRLGCLNLHMGLLPEYRGPAALQWMVARGERVTGATLHYVDEGIDTGPMLAQARVPIAVDDDIAQVMRAVREAGIRLLREGWPHFSVRRLPARAQDEARARYWPRRTDADDRIAWSVPAETIRDLVRATAPPFPGAHTTWRGRRIVIRECAVDLPLSDAPPGRIAAVDASGLRVATGNGALSVTRLEEDGRALRPDAFAPGQAFV